MIYLAVLQAYDPSTATLNTLYYGTRGYISGAGDTPANTYFDGRISQPAVVRRDMFSFGTTSGPSRVGFGDLVLRNGDGEIDFLKDWGVDGRAISIWYGPFTGSYPGDFTNILTGTMQSIEVGRDNVTIKLRDRQLETQVPLQTTLYAGTNVLPDGLEGVADDLRGKPKPVCVGEATNVPAVCVNTSKLIYQVNDGPIFSLAAVYDRGIELAPGREWTPDATDPFSGAGIYCGAYGSGVYVLGGSGAQLYRSTDASAWTAVTSSFSSTGIVIGAAWDHGVFVICGQDGDICTSTDGSAWTLATTLGLVLKDVAYDANTNLWVVVGSPNEIAVSADDGATWSEVADPGFSSGAVNAVVSGGDFIVVAGDGGIIATSTDGTNWTHRTSNFFAATGGFTPGGLAYGNGVFFADAWINSTLTYCCAYSVDGIAWERVQNPLGTDIPAMVRYGDQFLLCGPDGQVASSEDAVTWKIQSGNTLMGTHQVLCSVYDGDNGRWIVAGASGAIAVGSLTDYSDATALQDDAQAPLAGEYNAYLAGGYFRLGSSPAGEITADVVQGDATANRTAGQLFALAMAKGGMTATATVTASMFSHSAGITIKDGDYANIVDGDIGTNGFHTDSASAGDTLAIDFGSGNAQAGTKIGLYTATTGYAALFDVQYSDDASAWTTALANYQRPLREAGWAYGLWGDVGAHRYWRLALTNTPGAGSWVTELEFHVGLWDSDDIATLDAAAAYPCGLWIGGELTVEAAANLIAPSVGAWWGVDKDGTFRIQQLLAPSGTPAYSFTANDMLRPLERIAPNDESRGVPQYRTTVRWGRVWRTQTDLASGVAEPHRTLVAAEYRDATSISSAVQTLHPLAPAIVEESLLATSAGAQAEANRRQVLRGADWDLYQFTAGLDTATAALDLGNVIQITHDRYGLSQGGLFRILSVEPDGAAGRVTFLVWGTASVRGSAAVALAPSVSGSDS